LRRVLVHCGFVIGIRHYEEKSEERGTLDSQSLFVNLESETLTFLVEPWLIAFFR